jgi:hypothetical protein
VLAAPGLLVQAVPMQHERCRTAPAVDLEGDLRILDLEEIVPGAFCEYFVFRLPRNLNESLAAEARVTVKMVFEANW